MENAARVLASAAALGTVFVAFPAAAQAPGACEAMEQVVIDGADVTSAREIDAANGLPAYCEVRVTARPAISIEVRLPLEGWSGKLYQTGCGGFCGILGRADSGAGVINAMRPGLEKGYATATSDSGHHGLSVVDATFADANPQGERDWGWRSIGETNRVANALIEAFYAAPASAAYFQGCSTGGRMAQRAALTYPEMFDGIIAGAPAIDYPGLVGTAFSYFLQANADEDGKQILKPGKEKLIGDEVMAQCDEVDGTKDGRIADPRQCKVDLSSIACTGESGDDCLTEAELEVVAKWRAGPRNAAGEQLYPGGIPEGSEPFWSLWLTGKPGGAPLMTPFATSFGQYMAFPTDPGPTWSPLDFDFEKDPEAISIMNSVYNADDPDLSAFIKAGGKMIVYHGWADPLVTPYKTVDWFEKASAAAGGQETLEDNVRLFMIPGMDHCGLQPGPGGISQANLDLLTPIEAWVEEGKAPDGVLKD
ncbi:tannase/feruloyl esterase family alpha/beta hydrolase [Acuticoccus sediminis]|uniref:Tannase/feruloyl esterase family alpha/beta hydrolase n=1 Tax=Acuticoccus sediminis TaxID=2184697 RepID=A0A8B2NZW6_9HYPH|nr:tannase/feruloyl esterase family alpha/beta hydrolase [Acuticoccus sediminis]RAI04371.1 tannase/feruloyl esterase family alpha/beta hydrolase [Acuticoccus sediminis]